jgi:RNA polymerase sigma-70 factor (ECF subfamily)
MDMGVPLLRIVHEADSSPHAREGGADAPSVACGEALAAAPAIALSVLRLDDVGTPSVSGSAVPADVADAVLVRRLLEGERGALEGLYRRHAAFAFKLAVRLQGSSQDVEDVVHDAFLKVQARLASLNDPALFRGWLGTIVVNEIRLRLRRGRLLRALRLQSAEPVELDSIASDAASPELRAQLAQVYALLRLMPTEERLAWTLRFVEHHRLEEVAELTECSLATVKRRLSAAQRFLAEHLVGDPLRRPALDQAQRGVL